MIGSRNAIICAVLLMASVSAGAAEDHAGKKSVPPAEQRSLIPVFALIGSDTGDSVSIDPIVLIDGATLRPVPDPCSESPALRDFEERYLKPGMEYPVVFGGAQTGTVVVKKLEATDYIVEPRTDVPIKGLTMALAVGSSSLSHRGGLRRNPTPGEQSHVEQFAKEIFTSKGVPAASLTRMIVEQVTAVELNHAARLVASVSVQREDKLGPDYNLFFVADPVTGEKSVLWFQHPKRDTSGEGLYLIDHLDLDGNGQDRLFVRRALYENYRYEVYKNVQGRWVKEFASQTFGCE